jgi:hypothetical protein
MNYFAVHNNILWCHEQLKFMSVVCCCFSDSKSNISIFCIGGVGDLTYLGPIGKADLNIEYQIDVNFL